jgi:hypothetical protein
MLVKFNGSLTQAQYDGLSTKDAGTLYFTTDTKRIYKGASQYSSGTGVAGLSYNESTDVFTITYVDGTSSTISFASELSAKEDKSKKGTAGGYAELDSAGKVPSSQLPSFVDDVHEYSSTSAFPATGEAGKIYVALDTNKTYRWGGSSYVVISESLALGETDATAYRGDRGKTAYDHSQTTGNPHGTTAAQVGAAPSSHVGAGGTTQHPLATATVPGFSSRDFTTDEKNKLAGIADNATAVAVENSLTSDSTANALSAAQGKALKTAVDTKMNKKTTATAGEIVVFGAGGDADDSNKTFVTSISASSTDAQVATAKAVVDALSWA